MITPFLGSCGAGFGSKQSEAREKIRMNGMCVLLNGMVMITPFPGPCGAGFGSKQSEANE